MLGRENLELFKRDDVPIALAMSDYVPMPEPGVYTVVVEYHDGAEIAGMHDVSNWITHRSRPLTFVWTSRAVRVDADTRAKVRRALGRLYNERPVAIVVGYRKGDDIARISESGNELLQLHYEAIPILADELATDTNPHHRAWLLAMLGSICGCSEFPTATGRTFGEFEVLIRQLAVGDAAYYYKTTGSGNDGGPKMDAQNTLVEEWARLSRMVTASDR